jgi:hypothetical protein
MARYDFVNDGGVLKISVQSQGGLYNSQSMSIAIPSISLSNQVIKLYNSGKYFDAYGFNDIGLIAGASYPNINEAYDALSILIGVIIST